MTLQITLQSLDGVPADIANEYIEQEDGSFKLDVAGLEDTGALKRAKEHEKKQRKDAEQKATELQSQLEALQEQLDELGKKGGKADDSVLRAKLEAKVADLSKKLADRETELLGEISRLTSTQEAERLVTSISDHPELLMHVVSSRLTTVMEDGRAVVKVKDADGDIGVMTIDELKKEIENNPKYAAVLRGSKGSGSGAPGNTSAKPGAKTSLSDYSGPERVALMNSNRAEYDRLLKLSREVKRN